MTKMLNTINNVSLQLVTIGCILFLIGCDNDNSNNDVAPERAQLIKITPAVSEIKRYTPEIELVFDKPVAQVKVNDVDADPNQTMSVGAWQSTPFWTLDLSLFDKIHPPTHPLSTDGFPEAQVCFTVSYVDETGIYQEDLDCVVFPLIDRGDTPPEIIEGTVKDGDVDVDADQLNLYGFTFRFSKRMVGYVEIYTEEGDLLCWSYQWSEGRVRDSVRLYLNWHGAKGKLLKGMVYTIIFSVSDANGNSLNDTITFTTKP